ncbi:MAG: ankyrin repeat domain-containing protein [Gammaproteobacteria bacterium]|nr:ankyrin repeat domain-containing protein [Gammaproteobacteria bacterium]
MIGRLAMLKQLPAKHSIADIRQRATSLRHRWEAGEIEATDEIRTSLGGVLKVPLSDADAKLVTARTYGFATWRQLEVFVTHSGAGSDFQQLACLNYFDSDRPANRERARAMLDADPALGTRDIWSAACVGDARAVANFLDSDPALIDARGGYFDWEPLLYACYSRLNLEGRSTLAVARLLIERSADPNAYYMWGGQYRFTALTGVFGEGEMGPVNQPEHEDCDTMAQLLLDAGADPNDGQALYNTMFTPGSKCLEVLLEYGLSSEHRNNWLVEENGKLVDNPDRVLGYQLQWAVRKQHVERARLLIDHGADLAAASPDGYTLFEAALRAGHPDLAQYLADHGAETVELDPRRLFVSACMRADADAARMLLESEPGVVRETQSADPQLLVDAAGSNRLAAVRLMLDLGFDPNPGDSTPTTPLHQAAFHGHIDMVKLLVDGGARLDARDAHHAGTPLEWAVVAGQTEVEAYLALSGIPTGFENH